MTRKKSGKKETRTPRSRYNAAFISKLQKALEKDAGADLDEVIAQYDSKRLKQLRGTHLTMKLGLKLKC